MSDAERLARVMWPNGRYGAEMLSCWAEMLSCCQRAIDAGWTPPPPTLAEAVASFRAAWDGNGADQSHADAMFDALDREADRG